MTTFDMALKAADEPAIAGLDLSMLDQGDLLNLALQRSEVLADQPRPNRIIRAWQDGDDGPLQQAVTRLGTAIARRAAAYVWLEYQALRPLLDDLQPGSLADIGCGYGFFGLFVHKDLGCRLTLIDTETNGHRRFHFSMKPAAYTSLDRARALLEGNGFPPGNLTTANPDRYPLTALRPVDLAVSFVACGFHFPWDVYAPFFDHGVAPGGSVILDLRRKKAPGALRALRQKGTPLVLGFCAGGKGLRVHLRKPRPVRLARAA